MGAITAEASDDIAGSTLAAWGMKVTVVYSLCRSRERLIDGGKHS
jgi:hypothetical protein